MYYRADGKLHQVSYCVMSDNRQHGSVNVQVFNGKIIKHLREKIGIIVDDVKMCSDGSKEHFKNTETMVYLSHHVFLHDCTADWNYSESYHGKGPHDGIGGAIKNGLRLRILRRSHVISNAEEAYNVAQEFCKEIHVLYVSSADLKTEEAKYKKLFEGRKVASGISQMRYVTVHTSNKIHMYKSYNERKPVNIKKPLTEM